MAKSLIPLRQSRADAIRKLLRQIRLKRGLSQADLSGLAKVAVVEISHLENGKRSPSEETMYKVCRGLGVSMSLFYKVIESYHQMPNEFPPAQLRKWLLEQPMPKRPRKSAHTGKFISR